MNIIDPILLVLLFLFALRGYFRGLFRESFSLLGLLIGFLAAVRFDDSLAALSDDDWKPSLVIAKALSFVLIFFVIYFTLSLTGWLLHRYTKLAGQPLNHIGGVVVGIGKGSAVLALMVFLLTSFPLMPEGVRQSMNNSYLATPLYQFARGLIHVGKFSLPSESHAGFNRQASGSLRGSG